jgi:archaemetzincin
MQERDFLPWWVRHQKWVAVLAGVLLIGGAGLLAWVVFEDEPVSAPPVAQAETSAAGQQREASFERLGEPDPGDWRARYNEKKQGFQAWRRGRERGYAAGRVIYLQPLAPFDHGASPDLDVLAKGASIYLGVEVEVLPELDVDELDVRQRENGMQGQLQYLTVDILDELRDRKPDDAAAVMALTTTDLWPGEGWNFVFGMASLRDGVGVQSFARYDPDDYILSLDSPRGASRDVTILRRSMKLVTHELGHTFGIRHCLHYRCAMNGTNSLSETDESPLHLCPVDLRKLEYAVGFDKKERYLRLAEFYREHDLEPEAWFVSERAELVK